MLQGFMRVMRVGEGGQYEQVIVIELGNIR